MLRILVIEDDELNRDMLVQRLEAQPYEVISATDGAEGLRCVETASPDLILLDMDLPEMDGWTLARQLKAAAATRPIPIIAVTAYAREGDEERARRAGCDAYTPKPVDFKHLLGTITELAPPS